MYILGSFIYEGSKLIMQQTPEGRLVFGGEAETFTREYYLKDHLGNNRVVFSIQDDDIQIEQSVNYYPFGLTFGEYNNGSKATQNRFLYNGKELQNDPENTLENLDLLDYGARFYDMIVPHLTTIDRFAEKYYSLSPYSYGAGNPISNIDVNGDTINVSSALEQNELTYKAFLLWKNSPEGKEFYKNYDVGGKYENVSVNFGLYVPKENDSESAGTRGETSLYAISKNKDGETVKIPLAPERTIQKMKDAGKNISGLRSKLQKGENLRAEISIDKVNHTNFIDSRGLTVLHETQHVQIQHSDIRNNGYIWYSGSDQHYLMKDTNGKWFKQRYEFYKRTHPNESKGQIEYRVNKFEYGRY